MRMAISVGVSDVWHCSPLAQRAHVPRGSALSGQRFFSLRLTCASYVLGQTDQIMRTV